MILMLNKLTFNLEISSKIDFSGKLSHKPSVAIRIRSPSIT